MQLKHLKQVVAIEKVSFPTPWSYEAFYSEIKENSFAHYFTALLNGIVVGYAGMWIILDEAHVTNVAVHPDCRRQRVGRCLMDELMRQALLRGADRITLEVRPSNTAALKLYEDLGFEPAGVRKGYYTDTREDAIIMWKQLLTTSPL